MTRFATSTNTPCSLIEQVLCHACCLFFLGIAFIVFVPYSVMTTVGLAFPKRECRQFDCAAVCCGRPLGLLGQPGARANGVGSGGNGRMVMVEEGNGRIAGDGLDLRWPGVREFVFSASGSYAILAARRWPSRLHRRWLFFG